MRVVLGVTCVLALAPMIGCGQAKDAAPQEKPLTTEELMDPSSCGTCHPNHYRQWAGSMHAYSADDPVFVAMNARGQRETKGALGGFCVGCHAPMAVALGTTKDGLDLASLPSWQKGVTCYFCHSIGSVASVHNADVTLEKDGVLRAGIADPGGGATHAVGYDALHDGAKVDSAALCGSCHEDQTGDGVHLSRTHSEWQASLFSHDQPGKLLSCAACHMPGRDDRAATNGPRRRVHDHTMPGVDVTLDGFGAEGEQAAAVQAELDPTLVAKLCIKPRAGGWQVEYSLDNAFAGHGFPSGAAYHRRAWAEITAWSGGAIVFHSGAVGADQAAFAAEAADPTMWLLGDKIRDAAGEPTEMLWYAAKIESSLLPPAVTSDPSDPAYYHALIHTYDLPPVSVERVRAEVHIRALDVDFVDDLIGSGDLDPKVRERLRTFTLKGTVLEWTSDLGPICIPK